MGDKLNTADYVDACRLRREYKTVAEAAAAAGLGQSAFKDRLRDAKAKGITADTPILDEVGKLKIALRRAKAENASLLKQNDTAESIRTSIYELASRTPEPPKWVERHQGKGSSRGMPMTIWSDWHFGETVRPEEVGGFNEFNADVAAKRIQTLVDQTISLCWNHMGNAAVEYPGIVVMLGGDMISGDLHEELFATNDRTTQQCINDLTDLLASALEQMADKFGRVFVPCVVGNHGRASKKPRMKGRVYTSHEWNIYCNLERHFRKDDRVTFLIPGESDAYFRVYGHRFLLTHGDGLGVKGGDGIIGALGPIARGSLKVGASEAKIGRDVDTIVMGHWHQYLTFPGVIVNNSLKGYDEYARLAMRAPYSRPSQALWFCHPEHGITAHWQVFLEAQVQPQDAHKVLTWNENRV